MLPVGMDSTELDRLRSWFSVAQVLNQKQCQNLSQLFLLPGKSHTWHATARMFKVIHYPEAALDGFITVAERGLLNQSGDTALSLNQ